MYSSKCSTSTHLFTLVRFHYVPWFPFSLSVGDLASVNGIHQWPVIRRWTTMFNLDTYIHIVGHVLSGLCRRPSILVAFHIWYLLDHASVHELWWFDSSVYQISSSTMEILIHFISSVIMEILIHCISSSTLEILIYCILYVAMTTHVTFCISFIFMAIVILCIRDCSMYL